MTITATQAATLRSQVAAFAISSADRRSAEDDLSWVKAQTSRPTKALEERVEKARIAWRKAHTQVHTTIDALEGEL